MLPTSNPKINYKYIYVCMSTEFSFVHLAPSIFETNIIYTLQIVRVNE